MRRQGRAVVARQPYLACKCACLHPSTHEPGMVSVLICREEEFKQFQKLMDEQIKEIASKEAEEAEEDAETREEREAFEQRQVEDIKCRGHEVQWQRRHAIVVG